MAQPEFSNGKDEKTFSPFVLIDCRDTEWSDVRLQFNDHDWTKSAIGDDQIGDCYLNGYGIQGMVIAARMKAGLEPVPEGMEPNSEGDTCFIHFSDLETAVETATLAHEMIHDATKRLECATLAVEEGLDDF